MIFTKKDIIPENLILLVVALWTVYIVEFLLPGVSFQNLGIFPRRIEGIPGIFFSPFLHGGLSHIVCNSIALVVLSIIIQWSVGPKRLTVVMFCGVIGSGLGTWIFSTGGPVIGASGLVYSLIGYLFADAYFRPNFRSWSVAILSFILYGGALQGLFVFSPYISWAAHFWGLVSGVFIAKILKNTKK